MATLDAAPKPRQPIIPSNFIDADVIKLIEHDMDMYERLCCIFFLIDDYTLGYQRLNNIINYNLAPLSEYIEKYNVADWEDKVMEGLCLLQNNEILLKLGVNIPDAHTTFSTKIQDVPFKVNKYAKAFYSLFESLCNKDIEKLLNRVYEYIPRPDRQSWPEKVSLEFHLLWWIQKEFIKVSEDKWTLKELLKILKELNMSDRSAYLTLKEYDVGDNDNNPCHLDHQANSTDNRASNVGINPAMTDNSTGNQYKINNGLVVIFNQMKFTGPIEYEYRQGSKEDCKRIKETFQNNFGFKTEIHDDLNKTDIYSELDRLRKRGKEFDCVVVFILSHGTCGNIVASDGAECSIETIQSKFCSEALRNKPKILVIQACQTQALTTDGPRSEQTDLGRFEDFLRLSSTMPGELAVRDPVHGTWFIRVLCEVLVEMKGRSIEESLIEVSSRFKLMAAKIGGAIVKQVPLRTSNLAKVLIFPCRARAVSG